MNRPANPSFARPRIATLVLPLFAPIAFALGACAPGGDPQQGDVTAVDPGEPPLAGATIGGDFELVNSSGETVRWDDFEGRYRIVYFGYAYCPDVCPTDMQRTIQGLNQFAEQAPARAEQVQPIFVSVDPERDTPEVLREFTGAFSEDLIGLTGTPEQVKAAADTFGVAYQKGAETSSGGYLVGHTNIVYLFGPEGEPIATLPVDLGADAVTDELAKWVS
ncbi:MAG: SCO family protein [Erythrobacter sp.]